MGKAPIWVLRSLPFKIPMKLHLVLLMGGEWAVMSTTWEELLLPCWAGILLMFSQHQGLYEQRRGVRRPDISSELLVEASDLNGANKMIQNFQP